MSTTYKAPAVRKAFEVLQLIASTDRGMGISELAKSLGISKGTVHGITSALEGVGVIIRNPFTKKYNLGYTVIELGKKAISKIPLREAARRHMERLVEETDETVFLGILRDDHILIVDVVESNKELKITSPSGTKLSLTAGAAAKVFLAYTDEKRSLEYLRTKGLPKYTENSITDLDAYLEEIKKVRKQGVATDREEYLQGVNAVAALIRSPGPFLAAIWVVGFSSSITEDRMEYIIGRTVAAAEAISQDLAVREQGQI
jgi:DNA-binding IclR family transcriptional regulator